MAHKKGKHGRGRPQKSPAPFGEKPNLTDRQWRGLEYELRGYQKGQSEEDWPSTTPTHIVAKAAGVNVRSVQGWRKDPEYLRGLDWLLARAITQQLDSRDKETSGSLLTRKQRAAQLHVYVKRNWAGSAESPIDKQIFTSIDDYVAHLLECGVVPMPDEQAKKKSD